MPADRTVTFTETERALALDILRRNGDNNITKAVMQEIANVLGRPVASSTLHRWIAVERRMRLLEGKSSIPDEVRLRATETLDAIWEQRARELLSRAGEPGVIEKMSGRDLIISAAVATDKMRLLRGLPTEYVQALPSFFDALKLAGIDPLAFMHSVMERIAITSIKKSDKSLPEQIIILEELEESEQHEERL